MDLPITPTPIKPILFTYSHLKSKYYFNILAAFGTQGLINKHPCGETLSFYQQFTALEAVSGTIFISNIAQINMVEMPLADVSGPNHYIVIGRRAIHFV